MLVLGVETSCDETAAAIVEDGRLVSAEAVASQNGRTRSTAASFPRSHRATHRDVVPVMQGAVAARACPR